MAEYIKGANDPKFIIVHHTASKARWANIVKFWRRDDFISIHYTVGQQGQRDAYIAEADVAFHAGVSKWGNVKDLNRHSIGIEVHSDGYNFTEKQRDEVIKLCKEIMGRHNIPKENVLTHAQVAMPRGRKWDVGPNFYMPKWGSWEGFQNVLQEDSDYEKEKKKATKWVQKKGISNGDRPTDNITREETWVMLKRYDDSEKKKG